MTAINYNQLMHCHNILIAGCTGSGKSTLLKGFIKEVTKQGGLMVLLDPKLIELQQFKRQKNVIIYGDTPTAIYNCLIACVKEMDRRYKLMKRKQKAICTESHIYIILDELADLMLTNKKAFLPVLTKLAQLCRGANIHLIIATQNPSRAVLTAPINLNLSTRVGLHCVSPIESRMIIQSKGLEELPPFGDCIIQWSDGSRQHYIIPFN